VVLSYAFALGASSLIFTQRVRAARQRPWAALFAFIFLIALGVDYNIFLVSRIREELAHHDARAAVVTGVARNRWGDHERGRDPRGDVRHS